MINPPNDDLPRFGSGQYDRLFYYFGGGLDVECDTIEIEYVDGMSIDRTLFGDIAARDFVRFNITRFVPTQDEMFDRVRDAFFLKKKVKVGAQLGGSGKVTKTEGFVVALKILTTSDVAKMAYSVLCPATDFT